MLLNNKHPSALSVPLATIPEMPVIKYPEFREIQSNHFINPGNRSQTSSGDFTIETGSLA